MQIGTTGACEAWHRALKCAMKLTKNANSRLSLVGTLMTVEDCSREVLNTYHKSLKTRHSKDLSLAAEQPWLREIPFPAQAILSTRFRIATWILLLLSMCWIFGSNTIARRLECGICHVSICWNSLFSWVDFASRIGNVTRACLMFQNFIFTRIRMWCRRKWRRTGTMRGNTYDC